jgi:hypothetical protein
VAGVERYFSPYVDVLAIAAQIKLNRNSESSVGAVLLCPISLL